MPSNGWPTENKMLLLGAPSLMKCQSFLKYFYFFILIFKKCFLSLSLSLVHVLCIWIITPDFLCFYGIPECAYEWVPDSVCVWVDAWLSVRISGCLNLVLSLEFFSFCFSALFNFSALTFVLSYYILSYSIIIPYKVVCFLVRDRKRANQMGREVRRSL